MDPARAERLALCDLLDELGPEGGTLLPGWRTARMAGHLLARETRPDALPGMVLPVAQGWTGRVERGLAATVPYDDMVRRLRRGPPLLSAARLPGGWRADLHDWFVHHEDVRRANGLGPRPDGDGQRRLDDGVWAVLPLFGPLLARRVEATVTLVSEDGRRRRVRRSGPALPALGGRSGPALPALGGRSGPALPALGGRSGPGQVEVHGRPSEMLLALFGRRSVAVVHAIGDPEAVHAWEDAQLGP